MGRDTRKVIAKRFSNGDPVKGKKPLKYGERREVTRPATKQELEQVLGFEITDPSLYNDPNNSPFYMEKVVGYEQGQLPPAPNLGRYSDVLTSQYDSARGGYKIVPKDRFYNFGNHSYYQDVMRDLEKQNKGMLLINGYQRPAQYGNGDPIPTNKKPLKYGERREITRPLTAEEIKNVTGLDVTDASLYNNPDSSPLYMEKVIGYEEGKLPPAPNLGNHKNFFTTQYNSGRGAYEVIPNENYFGNYDRYKDILKEIEKLNPGNPVMNAYVKRPKMAYGGSVTPELVDIMRKKMGISNVRQDVRDLNFRLREDGLGFNSPTSTQLSGVGAYDNDTMYGSYMNNMLNNRLYQDGLHVDKIDTSALDEVLTRGVASVQQDVDAVQNIQNYIGDLPKQGNTLLDLARAINDVAGADYGTEDAMFALGESIGFDPNKVAEDYRGVAVAGNAVKGAGALGKVITGSLRNINAGIANANSYQNFTDYHNRKERERMLGGFRRVDDGGVIPVLSKGGVVTPEKVLTGSFTTGHDRMGVVDGYNAEVEAGEYIQNSDGSVQEVIGDKHNKGGEVMSFNDHTRVISDKLKVGKDLAKSISNVYNLNVNASDTYATVLDKYKKKIGLSEKIDEESRLLKKAGKNESLGDDATYSLNREFLSNKLSEVGLEKQPLEQSLARFTDYIFKEQQRSKGVPEGMEDVYVTPSNNVSFDEGGVLNDPRFRQLMQSYGVSDEDALSVLQQYKTGTLSSVPLFADGGRPKPKRDTVLFGMTIDEMRKKVEEDPEFRDILIGLDSFGVIHPNALVERDLQHRDKGGQYYGGVQNISDRLKWNYERDYGLRQFIEVKDGVYNVKKGKEKEFQKYQQDEYERMKKSLVKSGVNPKAVDFYMKNVMYSMDNPDTASAYDGKVGDFTSSRSLAKRKIVPEETRKILADNGFYGTRSVVEAYNENPDSIKSLIPEEDYKKIEKDYNNNGNFVIDRLDDVPENPTPVPTKPDESTDVAPSRPLSPLNFESIPNAPQGTNAGWLSLPDQSSLPPSGVASHLMVDRTYERLDPVKVSYTPQLLENNRQMEFLRDNVSHLPDNQKVAVMANALATTQQNTNQAIMHAELANQRNFQQTEQFNINQSNMEENAKAEDLLSFEMRQYTALENSLRDFHDWFENEKDKKLRAWEFRNKVGIVNQMNENYKIGNSGDISYVDTGQNQFRLPPNVATPPINSVVGSTPTQKKSVDKKSQALDIINKLYGKA